MLASLIETCKLRSVNPQAYLTDVLTNRRRNLEFSASTEAARLYLLPRHIRAAEFLSLYDFRRPDTRC
jgi:IS66 C-terminal element